MTTVDEVARYCDDAGMKPDSPLRAALLAVARSSDSLLEATMGVQVLPQDGLARLEQAAVRGAERRAASLARAHNLRTLLGIGAVGLALMAVSSVTGFYAGRASVHETEQRLAVAFRDGPSSAETWASIIEQNDILAAMALCSGTRVFTSQTGRKACAVPLYIDKR